MADADDFNAQALVFDPLYYAIPYYSYPIGHRGASQCAATIRSWVDAERHEGVENAPKGAAFDVLDLLSRGLLPLSPIRGHLILAYP